MLCARVIRGMNSIASASKPPLAKASTRSRAAKGSKVAATHAPGLAPASESGSGAWTPSTISAPSTASGPAVTSAPASR